MFPQTELVRAKGQLCFWVGNRLSCLPQARHSLLPPTQALTPPAWLLFKIL